MAYRNVCRRGRSGGGRVRQDDISIASEILPMMDEAHRTEANAVRRTDPGMFRKLIQAFKRANPERVRELVENHNAQGPSPGIMRLLQEVVHGTPLVATPPKPAGFHTRRIDTHPGRHNADVHLEGRAADVYFSFRNPTERAFGDWLFDYCVANCERYKIQGVIFGNRQWYSEMNRGQVFPRTQHDHDDHVHIELNCDGANMR